MAKKTRNKKNSHLLKWIFLLVILFIITTITIAYICSLNIAPSIDKNATKNITTDKTNPVSNHKEQDDETPKSSNNFSASIISANINGELVQIRTVIYGEISNSGTCILKLTNNDRVVQKTAKTYSLPSSSTCQGFDINRSELSSGKWDIHLEVTIGSKASSSIGEIVLE